MRMQRGFTLIELMVVVAILGIIAAVAWPSYLEHLKAGRRGEATSGVGKMQLLQERWRAEHTSYGNDDDLKTLENLPTSSYYNFEVVDGSLTSSTYTITATKKGAQASDSCGNLSATASTKPTWSPGGAGCN